MLVVKCTSDLCLKNKDGFCQAEEVQLDGNKLEPKCQTVEWNPDELEDRID